VVKINVDPILKAMIEKARELGLKRGSVVILSVCTEHIYNEESFGENFFREPDPINRGPEDKGVNYRAFAFGKIFQSFRTGKPSCTEYAMKGESPARGCVISDDYTAYFACSGGTEEQDVVIANVGKELYEHCQTQKK